MKKIIEIGDKVSLKSAILFGLETYILDKSASNADPEFHIGTIGWGRESFGSDEATGTIVSFIEPPKPVEIASPPQNSPIRDYEWTVYIQGISVGNFDLPTYPAYELVAEIKRIIFELVKVNSGQAVNNILNLGPSAQRQRGERGNIYDIKIGSETVRGPGDHSRFAFFWLPLHMSIVEDLENPRTTVQNPL